jgi:hypothetical protein
MTEQWVRDNLSEFVEGETLITERDKDGNVVAWTDISFFANTLFIDCTDLTPEGIKAYDQLKGYGYTERGIINFWFGI